mgnify:CR=1 FL=1
MNKLFKILSLIIVLSGCKSQSEIGFYKNEAWLAHHSMCFVTRFNFRNDSTFEYYFQGDLFDDHELGKYKRIDDKLYLTYNKKTLMVLGYDTIKQKLDFNPPIEVTRIEPRLWDPGFRDNFPNQLQIKRNKLLIIQDQKMKIKPSDKKMKLKKTKSRNWNNRNATFMEYIRIQ